jgi:hypothetical protein
MIRADFIPALSWDWPIVPGKIMQGRPKGGGSCRNGLLHWPTMQLSNVGKTTPSKQTIWFNIIIIIMVKSTSSMLPRQW